MLHLYHVALMSQNVEPKHLFKFVNVLICGHAYGCSENFL